MKAAGARKKVQRARMPSGYNPSSRSPFFLIPVFSNFVLFVFLLRWLRSSLPPPWFSFHIAPPLFCSTGAFRSRFYPSVFSFSLLPRKLRINGSPWRFTRKPFRLFRSCVKISSLTNLFSFLNTKLCFWSNRCEISCTLTAFSLRSPRQ